MANQGTQLILKYFPSLSKEQISQFDQLEEQYTDWNSKINVISRKDMGELYIHHILHSLAIAKVQAFKPGASILDIGTGGGFPGIPLAILFPESNFVLVDSIGKKIKVVNEVSSAIQLNNVKGLHERGEKVDELFDFIVSRAVTRIKPFYNWTKGKFKRESIHELNNGILFLKGGDLDDELKESKLRHRVNDISEYFEEAFFETKKVVFVEKQ
jgi:16S rRNA (guanine527-N7)-methyltransferase